MQRERLQKKRWAEKEAGFLMYIYIAQALYSIIIVYLCTVFV